MISAEEYLYYTDRALDGMVRIVTELGDERAGRRPLPGANSPFALLTHCLGVVEFWAGTLVAGRPSQRDRDAEFTAEGRVEDLLQRVEAVRGQFAEDVRAAAPGEPIRGTPPAGFQGPDRVGTQSAALQHVFEELAQHHGQMEILRDCIAPRRPDAIRGSGVKWGSTAPDTIAAWVADMDLGVAPAIRDGLLDLVHREDFGYPFWRGEDPVVTAFEDWMRQRHGWSPRPGRTRVFTDVLQILQVMVEHTTAPGDGVAIHVPAYPPFLASIQRAGRRIVPLPMLDDGARWTFDTGRLAERLAGCRLLVLVNPHNPTGRVFDRAELAAVAAVAERLDLVVLTDEIHADLAYEPHRHTPFASLSEETAARTVTATSATKAFNLAALRLAVAHVGPPAVWRSLDAQPIDLYGTPGIAGRVATVAAWRESYTWLNRTRELLRRNRDTVAARLPHRAPEATYLSWIPWGGTDPAGHLERAAKVRLSPGADFSAGTAVDTAGFVRLNFATGPGVLAEMLDRLEPAAAESPRLLDHAGDQERSI
ncbi:aminotransferase class I/II-fold pyridoxal phosphate-dependent enzyme [Dactylosporangium sp. CA-152071]|uniref:aminotransferase class I/II-fold pyridoxal phosphate-dependent enzyme n=1 Tax=Dactylosporangium sp. CA-152071 TaxID=3239933 RepID=UPI003D8C98A7